MMTREEAILEFEKMLAKYAFEANEAQAIGKAFEAPRPVSREQVEKVFHGCEMCADWRKLKLKPCANGDLGVRADIGSLGEDDPFGLLVYDQYLPSGYVDFDFCPFCGAPKTGKAVDILLKRLPANKKSSAN